MTTRTRYVLITAVLVLAVGLGTGLVAYYVGFPTSAFSRRSGPEELQYVPRDASVVAYANVHDVMISDVRQKLRQVAPGDENGQREFQDATGISIENDIDHVVACLSSNGRPVDDSGDMSGLVLARGHFDAVRIESLMRDRGAHVEDYKGRRLVVSDHIELGADHGDRPGRGSSTFALAFIEPDLVAVGTAPAVRQAIDLGKGGANVTENDEIMNLVRSLETGNTMWAVGRFDALRSKAHLPESVTLQLPAITWFSAAGHIDGGIGGVIRAEARDEQSANNLRDVVRGFMALAKLQATSKPEMQAMLQSLELGGTGKTVALSFTVPSQVFDLLGAKRQAR